MKSADAFFDFRDDLIDWDSPLFHRVAVADGHGPIDERLAIDGDAVGGSDFVLSPVAFPDGGFFVVEDIEFLLERAVDFGCDFGHSVFFDQGQHGGFVGSDSRVESHDDARFEFPVGFGGLDFGVGLAEECEGGSICTCRGFDHMGDEAFVGQIVSVGQVLAAASMFWVSLYFFSVPNC